MTPRLTLTHFGKDTTTTAGILAIGESIYPFVISHTNGFHFTVRDIVVREHLRKTRLL